MLLGFALSITVSINFLACLPCFSNNASIFLLLENGFQQMQLRGLSNSFGKISLTMRQTRKTAVLTINQFHPLLLFQHGP